MKKTVITRIQIVLLFIAFMGSSAHSQTAPANGDTLNYNAALLRFPWVEGAATYQLEIAEEGIATGKQTYTSVTNTLLASKLEFGKKYKWRYCGVDSKGAQLGWTEPTTFAIGSAPGVDPEQRRYRVLQRDRGKTLPGLLFYDYAEVGVNRKGDPIWYLPIIDGVEKTAQVRDLKMTDEGTFTALFDYEAIEFDRDGKILWIAPDDGKVNGQARENYHHEFTKQANGNYLILGNGKEYRMIPDGSDSVEVEFGTVIEYNPQGDVVWCWNSKDYFTEEDLFSRMRGADYYDTETHMNACSMNDSLVIVGFRDISRIVVIDKTSREVIESYGGWGNFKEPHSATGFFRRQHSANMLRDGSIAVLNNDSIMDPQVVSSVVVFSRIFDEQPNSEKLFEFRFDFDTLTNAKTPKTGNVFEMSNGNLLINMGSLNRCIEVTRNSELVSDMFIEKFDSLSNLWRPFPQYRVNYAPSLYPFEFTSKVNENYRKKKQRTIVIRVYNVGNEADVYTVSGSYKKGALPETTVSIEPGQYQDISYRISTRKSCSISVCAEHCLYSESLITGKPN